jgi:hypothetical protein
MSVAHQHHVEECPSCGSVYKGKYCHSCGEKVFHPSDLGMKKFLSQTVDIFTHFDSKFLRSVKYLMLYPGYLVKAYITGNRVKYAKPMQVFVLANIVFYFFTHLIGVTDYSPNIGDHQYFSLSSYWIFHWAEGLDKLVINFIDNLAFWKQQKLELSNSKFYNVFFENSWIFSKTFIILLIPFLSLTFWALFTKRFKYFGGAVIFGVYFLSFQLIAFSITSIFIYWWHINIYMPFTWLFFTSPLRYVSEIFFLSHFEFDSMLLWVPYLYIALQKVKKGNPWLTFALSFLTGKIIFFLTFGLYKKILIVLTLLLMHHT